MTTEPGFSPPGGGHDGPDQSAGHPERARQVDLVLLLAGLLSLLVSAYLLADGAGWLPVVDPRWLLAGGAVGVGVLLLANSLRSGRHR
ncbi:hypothetical protein [Goodfellowiella coeruleoviolacea]|uniref:Uncharacterized protein n=1 Tax=Goodfellowiella coeruleoviolacea TaxID=334858 RepID=A0AAE3KKT3_9PSEU|nr:hypothetical protein [Goodfellowiella coeruleoviolacea]MCP2165758.1 hypothetical protein [Goodfellowiella coeruleoviolacea]